MLTKVLVYTSFPMTVIQANSHSIYERHGRPWWMKIPGTMMAKTMARAPNNLLASWIGVMSKKKSMMVQALWRSYQPKNTRRSWIQDYWNEELTQPMYNRWQTSIRVQPHEEGLWQVIFVNCKQHSTVSFHVSVSARIPCLSLLTKVI